MYEIKNILEDRIIFSGNENEFIHFVRKIAVENDDEEMSITCFEEAFEYIEVYCENLYNVIYEYCPHCNNEVLLVAKFEIQECPECKNEIFPCSICNTLENESSCANCPLIK